MEEKNARGSEFDDKQVQLKTINGIKYEGTLY